MANNLPALIHPEETKTLMAMSDNFFKSGLYPNIKNSAGAFAVVQYGRELGIPPMTAMQTMAIVKGKITMMGAMLQTLLIRGGVKITIIESTIQKCTLKFEREGYPTIQTSFGIEDAKRAELYKEDSGYMKYPEEMFYWRAMTKGGRRIGSDLMLGIYAREEIEGDDSIIDVTPRGPGEPGAKKFVPTHRQTETAPPVDTGDTVHGDVEEGPITQYMAKEQPIDPDPMGILDVVEASDSSPITPDEVKDTLADLIDPAQELFDRLHNAIKEVEDSGNKFRWKNWLKKHQAEINSLKPQNETLWAELAKYVAFLNNKWNKEKRQ